MARPIATRVADRRTARASRSVPARFGSRWFALALLAHLLSAALASAASWDDVLGRYRACRQRLKEVGVQVEQLGLELAQVDQAVGSADEAVRTELQDFSQSLEEQGEFVRDGLRRVPALLDGIERELAKYRDSRSCPECVDSSTRLLCATIAELARDAEECLRSAGDLRSFLSGDLTVAPLLAECRERWSEVRSALASQDELSELEPELLGVASALAEAAAALEGGQPTHAMVRVLRARQDLARLATYLEMPP